MRQNHLSRHPGAESTKQGWRSLLPRVRDSEPVIVQIQGRNPAPLGRGEGGGERKGDGKGSEEGSAKGEQGDEEDGDQGEGGVGDVHHVCTSWTDLYETGTRRQRGYTHASPLSRA